MPLKITDLPPVPTGIVSSDISIPVSKSETDPKTYRMSLAQTLTWLNTQGIGAGGAGISGYSGASIQGAQGSAGAPSTVPGPQGVPGTTGYSGFNGNSGFSGFIGSSGFSGFQGNSGFSGFQGSTGYSGFNGNSGFSGWTGSSGFSGVSGKSGFSGPPGANNGAPGPGLVYTGYYRGPNYVYYDTPARVDVAGFSGGGKINYYIARSSTLSSDTFSGYTGWGVPGVDTADWSSFGENFASVATDLLLAQDVSVTQGIVLGTVDNLSAGFIRTANADWPGTSGSHGVWMGNYTDGNAYLFVGNYPNNGLLYRGDTGQLELSGTIFANAGSIGGVGLTQGSIYTGVASAAGTKDTPFFLNGSYDNGSSDRTYMSLGDTLKYFRASGTNYMNVSGGITATYGSIGGVGIAAGAIYTGVASAAGTKDTPFFLNGSYDNGSSDRTYFTLGDTLKYYRAGNTNYMNVSGGITATYGSIGGVGIATGAIYTGVASAAGTAQTPFYVNGAYDDGVSDRTYMTLGNTLKYFRAGGTNYMNVSGGITATYGSIAGVGMYQNTLYTGVASAGGTANTPFFLNGTTAAADNSNVSQAIFYLGDSFKWYKKAGVSAPTYNMLLGSTGITSSYTLSAAGNYLWWDGTTLTLKGSLLLPDGSSAVSSSGVSAIATATLAPTASAVFTDSTGAIVKTPSPTSAGLYLGSNNLGYYNGSAWKTYMANNGNFYLSGPNGDSLTWANGYLTINGAINLTGGQAATDIATANSNASTANSTANTANSTANTANSNVSTLSGKVKTDSNGKLITDASPSGSGLFLGQTYMGYYVGGNWNSYFKNDGTFAFNGTGSNSIYWNGSTLTVRGTIKVSDGTEVTSTVISNANSALQNNQTGKNLGLSGGTVGGVTINSNSLTLGTGTYGNSNTAFYVGNSGFSLGSNLTWDNSTLTINGSIAIADNSGNAVKQGKTSYGSGTGFWLGDVSGTAKFDIGNSSNYMRWDGSNLNIHGVQTDDGIIVTSYVGLRYVNNSGVLTVTGGQANGISNGAQIDFAGNTSAAPGVLSLNAGVGGGNGYIRFATGPDLGSGANTARMTIDYSGLVRVYSNLQVDGSITLGGVTRSSWPSDGGGSGTVTSVATTGGITGGTITSSGTISLDSSYSATFAGLTVNGTVTAQNYNTSSSRKWKTNITPIVNALDTVSKLQGVTFDWNNKDLKNDFGLIAEDVNEVLPTIVTKDKSNDVTGVDYGRLTAMLIEAVKELSAKVKQLENK